MGDPVATEDAATVDVVGVAVASGKVVGTTDDSHDGQWCSRIS